MSRRGPRSRSAVLAPVVGVAAVFGAVASFPVEPAAANSACGGFDLAFDGWSNYPASYTYEGEVGIIRTAPTLLCTGTGAPQDSESAWVMTQEPTSPAHISQSGFVYIRGYTTQYPFYEAHDGVGDDVQNIWTTLPLHEGDLHTYKNIFTTSGCGGGLTECFKGYYDGNVLGQSPFDPLMKWSANHPWRANFFAEGHYLGDDPPGTSASRAKFTGIEVQTWSANNFVVPPNSALSTPGVHANRGTTFHSTSVTTCSGNPCFDVWGS